MSGDAPSQAGDWPLFKAAAHRFGEGKTHLLRAGEKRTRCGKSLEHVDGHTRRGDRGDIDCKGCLDSLDAELRREQQHARWEAGRREWEERKREEDRQWWEDYSNYLLSPSWWGLRKRVLERAGGRCEGCGEQPATQVHHKTYTRVFDEMLFDLVAVCDDCHRRLHPDKDWSPW